MRKSSLILALLLCFSLFSCTAPQNVVTHQYAVDLSADPEDTSLIDFAFSARDTNATYDAGTATTITLDNENTVINGAGASLADGNLLINKEGTYILSGKYTVGMLRVECTDTEKVQIVLNGVEIYSPNSPAVYVKQADKVFFTLAKGTENKLTDGDKYTIIDGNSEIDAALFSRADMTVNGEGKLLIFGNNKHGIISKDDLVITGGDIQVRSKKVALNGKDCVKIGGGNIVLDAGSDGIRSDNNDSPDKGYIYINGGTLKIDAERDGIQSENVLRIDGGDISLNCGGGSENTVESNKEVDKQPEVIDPNKAADEDKPESYKGIKSEKDMIINGGRIIADTADISLYAEGCLVISGGAIKLSSGGDAAVAEKSFSQSGGALYVTKALNAIRATAAHISGGETSLICSEIGITLTGAFQISGGYLIAKTANGAVNAGSTLLVSGGAVLADVPADGKSIPFTASASAICGGYVAALSNGSASAFDSTSTQLSVSKTIGTQSEKTAIALCDEKGNVVVSFTASGAFDSVLLSSPSIKAGKTYSIMVGGTAEAADANGYTYGGALNGGTSVGDIEFAK